MILFYCVENKLCIGGLWFLKIIFFVLKRIKSLKWGMIYKFFNICEYELSWENYLELSLEGEIIFK